MIHKPMICIFGTTASGKTGAAIALSKKIDGEIVSADSVQVYRGMDIGSAKPTPAEQHAVKHHMMDCVEIDEKDFSVSKYFSMASKCIGDIDARGKRVLVAGGSGLYANALTKPLNFAIPSDKDIRAEWEKAYEEDPKKAFETLSGTDPATAARLHPNDKKRIVRALEVYFASGKPLSSFGNDFQNDRALDPPFPSLRFGLTLERELLYRRIGERVDKMLDEGLIEEARGIYDRGYSMLLPAMQSIGYAQLFRHFSGETTLDEAVDAIKRDTRRFAKRQLTWFKRDGGMRWIDVTDTVNDSEAVAEEIYDIMQKETE